MSPSTKDKSNASSSISSVPRSIRHVEKRRISTCRFADRVAATSIAHYKRHVPDDFWRSQQTCLAAVLAYSAVDDQLHVISMGVGTKFLSSAILKQEESSGKYGRRVRDCHAEVLARRAFQRHLALEMLDGISNSRVSRCTTTTTTIKQLLERSPGDAVLFRLRPDISLHFYCSSAPCGNALLKKFATLKKETFQDLSLWPTKGHERIHAHSISLGQFALLLKRDNHYQDEEANHRSNCAQSQAVDKSWPIFSSTAWCPPGTTTTWSGQGRIHTCSDKICRWNCLGWQGSLLASCFDHDVNMTSVTIGRKYSSDTCRRALCCRAESKNMQVGGTVHHPAIMCSAVYVDEHGTTTVTQGEDRMRFHLTHSWAWWPALDDKIECIDGSTGFIMDTNDGPSEISTASLVGMFLQIDEFMKDSRAPDIAATNANTNNISSAIFTGTLSELRRLKREKSSSYEERKAKYIATHPVLRHWKQR